MMKTSLAAMLAAMLLTSVSCSRIDVGFTRIGDLLAAQREYSGRQVKVRGDVTDVFKLPFVSIKMFKLRDASGEIVVFTDREPPFAGATGVRVKGVLDTIASIGERNIGVHLREIERR
jgi:hypothetical protein